jgi:hypothetical protein
LNIRPDFSATKEWLQETVEDQNHRIIFFPKYHCELNFIEMVWGFVKNKLRRHCKYSYSDLERNFPVFLDEVPISFVKKAARHCYRFMSGYRNTEFTGPLLDYIMKKYSSHRKIPLLVEAEIKNLKQEYKVKLEKKYDICIKKI